MTFHAPRILDAKGREIRVGDRVKHDGREYTVVSLGAPYGDIVRIGYWHGSLDEYKPHFCIPGTVAEETNGGDFLCSDLQLLDDREESSNEH